MQKPNPNFRNCFFQSGEKIEKRQFFTQFNVQDLYVMNAVARKMQISKSKLQKHEEFEFIKIRLLLVRNRRMLFLQEQDSDWLQSVKIDENFSFLVSDQQLDVGHTFPQTIDKNLSNYCLKLFFRQQPDFALISRTSASDAESLFLLVRRLRKMRVFSEPQGLKVKRKQGSQKDFAAYEAFHKETNRQFFIKSYPKSAQQEVCQQFQRQLTDSYKTQALQMVPEKIFSSEKSISILYRKFSDSSPLMKKKTSLENMLSRSEKSIPLRMCEEERQNEEENE